MRARAYFPPTAVVMALVVGFVLTGLIAFYYFKFSPEHDGVILSEGLMLGGIAGLIASLITATLLGRHEVDYTGRLLDQADRTILDLNHLLTDSNESLMWSNYQLKNILQALKGGVIATHQDGTVFILTERAQTLLGPAQVSDIDSSNKLSAMGTNYARLAEMGDASAEKASPVLEEISVCYPENRILQIYTTPFIAKNRREGELYFIEDVTHLRQLEVMRSDFVSNVTHELKTPLTSIHGYIELLRSDPRDPETRALFYDIIDIETDRLKSLIEDLLDLSEIEHTERGGARGDREENLFTVVEEVRLALTPLAESAQVEIRDLIPEDLRFTCNRGRFTELFTNLMSNAIRYNRPGGFVEVSGGIVRDRLELIVRDNGIGIAEEEQRRVFERFYRVDKARSRQTGGTGLGLSIVKHIVNLYEGTITLTSKPGEGSSFVMHFPLS